jgi:hypothetical protein
MITDDLSTLFGGGTPGVRFRQGTILAWNSATGENTVDLAGGTLVNVPIINTGEAIALKAGHVVGMLGQGSTWFIIGRVTPPNDPNFAGASVAFAGEGASAANFALTTSSAAKVTGSLTVPTWADEAIVLATSNMSLWNTRAVVDFATASIAIDGVGGGTVQAGFAPDGNASGNYLVAMACSAQRLVTSPGSTISLETRIWSNGAAWSAHPNNLVNLDAIAIFRSIA